MFDYDQTTPITLTNLRVIRKFNVVYASPRPGKIFRTKGFANIKIVNVITYPVRYFDQMTFITIFKSLCFIYCSSFCLINLFMNISFFNASSCISRVALYISARIGDENCS